MAQIFDHLTVQMCDSFLRDNVQQAVHYWEINPEGDAGPQREYNKNDLTFTKKYTVVR